MSTTKIEFDYKKTDFFQIVDEWAKENKFTQVDSQEGFRYYRKGGWWSWNAHPRLKTNLKNGKALIEYWICPIWGGKLDVSSDEVLGFAAKKAARKFINKLLERFNQRPIT